MIQGKHVWTQKLNSLKGFSIVVRVNNCVVLQSECAMVVIDDRVTTGLKASLADKLIGGMCVPAQFWQNEG